MRDIKLEKVTLNIGVGESGAKLDKAVKLLNTIAGQTPVRTLSKKRIPTWKIGPGLTIGSKVTLRGEKALKLLRRLLACTGNKLKPGQFDKEGNFSFGIKEYLDIPDVKYDPDIGIIGLEVAVTLQRAGFRIKRRTLKSRSIPLKHRIKKDEAMAFVRDRLGIEVIA